ncbi:hypothetical protein U9M48_022700 [Paspalum notatum var. saurae]|uniref:Uncharacterized protein n=1 Tax=Paspalum notatum var. saurae TaxID=547442 RepID=A0AAQ3TMB0_PASNO
MSLDDINKKISECRQSFIDNTISKQVPMLIEKVGALYRPMAEKMERSKNKSDAKNKSLALDMGARYRDLEAAVRGFVVKKFSNKKEEAGESTSPATPPAVDDKESRAAVVVPLLMVVDDK